MQLAPVLPSGTVDPPAIFPLVAHPIRWHLLCELVRSDRSVRELTQLVGERQSLVSYHLGQLRSGELVRAHRSSADGRDSYYAVDLARCSELLQRAGSALHPALRLVAPPREERVTKRRRGRRPRVLFLCTGNSARSQIAEALLERMTEGAVEAESAGSKPKPLHPNAVRVLRKRGIDISANRTKHLDEFVAQRFDLVITLCDRVREVCPEFPGAAELVHWSIADPAAAGPDDRSTLPAFEQVATELETRIDFLIRQLEESPARRSARAQR